MELCEKAQMESHLMMIEEVICNDSMRRIVHKDEIVLDIVLRWSYWDENDRKENYLIIKNNKLLHDMAVRNATAVCGELRIANEAGKNFKIHMFECNNTKLCYFKDKQVSFIQTSIFHLTLLFTLFTASLIIKFNGYDRPL